MPSLLKKLRREILLTFGFLSGVSYADFYGGDLIFLAELLANSTQQLAQLQSILGQGNESFQYLKDINSGVQEAMSGMKSIHNTLDAGVFSDLSGAQNVFNQIQTLYGQVPKTPESNLQQTMDQSVAESIHLHNEVFRYAEQIDPEAERIKEYAKSVSPLGAGRITAQSMGVVIHVLNQILRTNAAMLKIQSEQLALMNRKEKLSSSQFKSQYQSLSAAFKATKPAYRLSSLK